MAGSEFQCDITSIKKEYLWACVGTYGLKDNFVIRMAGRRGGVEGECR